MPTNDELDLIVPDNNVGYEDKMNAFLVTKGVEGCQAYNTTKNAFEVTIQDSTNEIIWGYFEKTVSPVPYVLASDVTVDAYTMVLTSVTGLTVGDRIGVFQGGKAEFFNILAINTNTLTLDTPICCPFTIAGAAILELTREMAVDGSVTAQKYELYNGFTKAIDITGVHFCIACTTEPDMIKFGNLTALTRGVVLRVKRANGTYEQIANIKCNGDLGGLTTPYSLQMYYEDTNALYNGVACRVAFAGQQNFGAVIRLVQGDSIEILVQDDIDALTNFRATYFGHITD